MRKAYTYGNNLQFVFGLHDTEVIALVLSLYGNIGLNFGVTRQAYFLIVCLKGKGRKLGTQLVYGVAQQTDRRNRFMVLSLTDTDSDLDYDRPSVTLTLALTLTDLDLG